MLFIVSWMVGMTALAHSFEEALEIYNSKFSKSPPSVYESGDYIYVVQEGFLSSSSDGSLNRITLKGQLDALEAYVGKPTGKQLTPFSPALTAELIPLLNFHIPTCWACKVAELRYHGKFRHVSAFEAGPIREARRKAHSDDPVSLTTQEWCELIARKLTAMGLEREQEVLWNEIGATFAVIPRLGGGIWNLENVDGIAAAKLRASWKENVTAKECFAALNVDPSFEPAQLRLSALKEGMEDVPRAMSRMLKGSFSVPHVTEIKRLAELADKKYGCKAWTEYSNLYADTLKKTRHFTGCQTDFWRYVLNSFGHVWFPTATHDACQKAQGIFKEAKSLYSQGRDLERIIALLKQSIEYDPNDFEKWRYLGAALRTAGDSFDAVLAYNEAMVLNPKDDLSQVDSCVLYKRMGYGALACGNAWFCMLKVEDDALKGKVLDILND